jgi:hypothetical protein
MIDRLNRGLQFRIAARRVPLVLALLTAGCAGSMGTMHPDTSSAPSTAFDGSYQIAITLTSAGEETTGTTWCNTPGQATALVKDGVFTYAVPHPSVPGNPTPTFTATFTADGAFIGQGEEGTILGHVTGTKMEGNIDGAACGYAFTGNRM